MSEVTNLGIDGCDAAFPIDNTFADVAAGIDPEAQKDLRTARPLIEELALEITPTEDWRH